MVIQNKTGGWKPPSIIPIEDIGSIVAEPRIPDNIFGGFKPIKPIMNAMPLPQPDDSASMSCKELKVKLSEMKAFLQVANFRNGGADEYDKEILAVEEKLASCSGTLNVPDVENVPLPVVNPNKTPAITPNIITTKSNYLKPVLIGISIIAVILVLKKILK
jgi:hypothetical protein